MRHIVNAYEGREAEMSSSVTDEWLQKAAGALANSIEDFYAKQREIDDYDPYTGISGVAYSYRQAAHVLGNEWAEKARKLQKKALKHKSSNVAKNARYLCGHLGTLAVEAGDPEASHREIVAEIEAMSNAVASDQNPSDELFVGRAGYLAAVQWVRNTVDPSLISNDAVLPVLKAMIQSGMTYSRLHNHPSWLMYEYHGTEYLGAAHGLAGILLCALDFYEMVNEDEKKAVREAVNWLASVQDSTGNFASSTKYIAREKEQPGVGHAEETNYFYFKKREEPLIHWCHGAPGVIGVFLKMYKLFGEERHLQIALRGGELIWREGILKKGPGLCHGVSGNGYLLLMLWRTTGNDVWLQRAQCFALLMMNQGVQQQQRVPDEPYSLFEGWAGGLCFLVDLLSMNRQRPRFPLYPLFL